MQLEDKERQKRLAIKEKEQRKKEREEKKAKREQERKQKAEERAKRAEEKARKAAEKKASSRMSGRVQKTPEGSGKTAKDLREKTIRVNHARTGAGVGGDHKNGDGEPVRKKPRRSVHATDNAESDIDENVCCMCFESYFNDVAEQSGRDWVNCACGRWLHEECAEDHKIDSIGKDRFGHYCLDLLNWFCVVFVAESCLCVCLCTQFLLLVQYKIGTAV